MPILIPKRKPTHESKRDKNPNSYSKYYSKKNSEYYSEKGRYYFVSSSRIFYPIRPIFTFLVGLALLGLAWTPFFPVGLAVYLGVGVMTDDMIMFPFLRLLKAKSNILHSRKGKKALVNIFAITLAYIAGAALGFFLFTQIPALTAIAAMAATSIACGLTVLMACSLIGVTLFHLLNQPPMLGALLGGLVSLCMPRLFSVNVDVVLGSTVAFGFVAALMTKYAMRLYYKLTASDTNADGYRHMRVENDETMKKDHALARVFKMQPELIRDLRQTLVAIIKTIKKEDTFLNEFGGLRQKKTECFKDILNALLTAKNEGDVKKVQQLLKWQMDYETYSYVRGNINSAVTKSTKTSGVIVNPIKSQLQMVYQFASGHTSCKVLEKYGFFSYFTNSEARYRLNVAQFHEESQKGLDICREKNYGLVSDLDNLARQFITHAPSLSR